MSNKKNKKHSLKIKIISWLKRNSVAIALATWFTGMWSWTLFTDTLDLAGNKRQGLILAIIILAINVSLSVFVMLKMIALVNRIFKEYNIVISLLLAWPLFALADFLVAWVPAALWIGPQGRLDSILPLSTPTLLLINTPLAFSSRFIGFFGLGGFVWFTAYLIWNKRLRKYSLIPLAILTALSFVGWNTWKQPNGTTIKAAVVTETFIKKVPAINDPSLDLAIFPEYGLDDVTNKSINDRLVSSSSKPIYFIGSKQVNPSDKVGHYNRLLFGSTKTGITLEQDKYRLIPGGEDLPYILRTGLRATNQTGTLDYFSSAKGTLKGSKQLQMFDLPNGTRVASAVCSSIIAPEDYRNFANKGATIFTNSASLNIFKGSPLFAWQQKSFAKFMAISNSRYFLQSANSARAYVLDNNGETLVESPGHKVLTQDVVNNNKKTLYTLTGEVLTYIGAVVLVVMLVKILRKKK